MAPKTTSWHFGLTALVAIIVARFSRSLNSPYRSQVSDGGKPHGKNRQRIGAYGEDVAADWLRAHRCRILARNFRGPRGGEVDIIARDGRLLLFIEVKTRRKGSSIRPLDAVNAEKRQFIERGASAWLRRLGTRQLPWRFDVIEVYYQDGELPRVNHVRDAF